MTVDAALEVFGKARGHRMNRDNLVEALRAMSWCMCPKNEGFVFADD